MLPLPSQNTFIKTNEPVCTFYSFWVDPLFNVFLLHESHKNWYLKWNHPSTRDHPQLLVRFMLLMLLFFILRFVCYGLSVCLFLCLAMSLSLFFRLMMLTISLVSFTSLLLVMLYIVSKSCDSEIDVRFTTLTIVKDRIRTLYELFMFYCCISDNM